MQNRKKERTEKWNQRKKMKKTSKSYSIFFVYNIVRILDKFSDKASRIFDYFSLLCAQSGGHRGGKLAQGAE